MAAHTTIQIQFLTIIAHFFVWNGYKSCNKNWIILILIMVGTTSPETLNLMSYKKPSTTAVKVNLFLFHFLESIQQHLSSLGNFFTRFFLNWKLIKSFTNIAYYLPANHILTIISNWSHLMRIDSIHSATTIDGHCGEGQVKFICSLIEKWTGNQLIIS